MTPFVHIPSWPHHKDEIVKQIIARPGFLKIVLKIRDELHFLTEWLEHHKEIVGLENIIIFDNSSSDFQLGDFYKSLPDEVVVARFHTIHNLIHKVEEFPDLYDALSKSSSYFIFLDADEFLVMVNESLDVTRRDIVDAIRASSEFSIMPTIWLNNGVGSRVLYECFSSDQLGGMLYAGKPIIRSAEALSGWLLHNYHMDRRSFSNDVPLRFFVQHRLNLFPERRIEATITKMAAVALIPERWTAEQILRHDFSAVTDPGLYRYLNDLKKFVNGYSVSTFGTGFINMSIGRKIEFYSQSEFATFDEFLRPSGQSAMQRYLGMNDGAVTATV